MLNSFIVQAKSLAPRSVHLRGTLQIKIILMNHALYIEKQFNEQILRCRQAQCKYIVPPIFKQIFLFSIYVSVVNRNTYSNAMLQYLCMDSNVWSITFLTAYCCSVLNTCSKIHFINYVTYANSQRTSDYGCVIPSVRESQS